MVAFTGTPLCAAKIATPSTSVHFTVRFCFPIRAQQETSAARPADAREIQKVRTQQQQQGHIQYSSGVVSSGKNSSKIFHATVLLLHSSEGQTAGLGWSVRLQGGVGTRAATGMGLISLERATLILASQVKRRHPVEHSNGNSGTSLAFGLNYPGTQQKKKKQRDHHREG